VTDSSSFDNPTDRLKCIKVRVQGRLYAGSYSVETSSENYFGSDIPDRAGALMFGSWRSVPRALPDVGSRVLCNNISSNCSFPGPSNVYFLSEAIYSITR